MNQLSIIEPAPKATASPLPSLKEDAPQEGDLLFATLVDIADPAPAIPKLPIDGDSEPTVLATDSAEIDPKTQNPEGDLAVPLASAPVPPVPKKGTKTAHEIVTHDPRQAAPPLRAQLGGDPKQTVDDVAAPTPSPTAAKAEGESQQRKVTTGPSAAQTMVEGRIAQVPKHVPQQATLPTTAVAKGGEAPKVQPDMPPDPKQIKRAEGQPQFAPAPAQPAVTKNAPSLPPPPSSDQPVRREQSFRDRATPAAPDLQRLHTPHPAPAQAIAAVQPAIGTAQNAKAIGVDLPERAAVALDPDGLQGLTTQDRPIVSMTATGSVATAGMETARHAAQQIATAVIQSNGKATEIALNPEELGRVRMSLSAADGALTLLVLADRPETQELLRRHIDVLAQEFRSLGYDSVSFSFDADGQSGSAEEQGSPDQEATAMMAQSVETEETRAPVLSNGLDLRL